ncbi:MAG: MoaD/ThiS family protein [Caldilineae bacterium]|nr:MAG: MoaD/ThiS family protein [Caldilineae bacterium]
MAVVRIPSPLRRYTGGQSKVSVAGATVIEVIDHLDAAYPGLKSRICDESGQIKRYVNIFINEDEIRTLQGAETPVGERDEVSIVPAMAGGSDEGR